MHTKVSFFKKKIFQKNCFYKIQDQNITTNVFNNDKVIEPFELDDNVAKMYSHSIIELDAFDDLHCFEVCCFYLNFTSKTL